MENNYVASTAPVGQLSTSHGLLSAHYNTYG